MRIEPVTRDQFAEWRRLRQAVFSGLDEPFHDEEMEWLFASPEAACFLAWSDTGDAVGLLELSLRNFVDGCLGGPVGYVDGLYLCPEYRGRGHGKQLLDFAAQWCVAQGCREMATDAEIENTAAQEFYRRAGFTEGWRVVGFRKPLSG